MARGRHLGGLDKSLKNGGNAGRETGYKLPGSSCTVLSRTGKELLPKRGWRKGAVFLCSELSYGNP